MDHNDNYNNKKGTNVVRKWGLRTHQAYIEGNTEAKRKVIDLI